MFLVGVISFSPEFDPSIVAQRIFKNSFFDKGLIKEEVISTQSICITLIKKGGAALPIQYSKNKDTYEFLLGDFCYSNQVNGSNETPKQFLNSEPPGRWLKVQAVPSEKRIIFTTDLLGSQWVYYAKVNGGYIFSSDFGALIKSMSAPPELDPDVIAIEALLTYCPGENTIFKNVKVMGASERLEFNSRGIEKNKVNQIVYGDYAASLNEKQKIERLDEIFDRIVKEYVEKFKEGLILSLSAGYDSRYALGILNNHRINPELCTFGNPESREVQNAQLVAESIGSSTNIFDCKQSSWNDWLRSIQMLGTAGMIQWNGWGPHWLNFQKQFGSASIIGYLGDAITGKHLGSIANSKIDWMNHWIIWSARGNRLQSPLIPDQSRKGLKELVHENLYYTVSDIQFAFPHQLALFLDLFGRQRRRVANQANLISRYLTPILFFHDKELIEFFASLELKDSINQSFYVRYANERFPSLFNVYNQHKKPTVLNRITTKYNKLIGSVDEMSHYAEAPKVIEHRGLIKTNMSNIIRLINNLDPSIKKALDVDVLLSFLEGTNNYNLTTHQVIQAINFCILANLIN